MLVRVYVFKREANSNTELDVQIRRETQAEHQHVDPEYINREGNNSSVVKWKMEERTPNSSKNFLLVKGVSKQIGSQSDGQLRFS